MPVIEAPFKGPTRNFWKAFYTEGPCDWAFAMYFMYYFIENVFFFRLQMCCKLFHIFASIYGSVNGRMREALNDKVTIRVLFEVLFSYSANNCSRNWRLILNCSFGNCFCGCVVFSIVIVPLASAISRSSKALVETTCIASWNAWIGWLKLINYFFQNVFFVAAASCAACFGSHFLKNINAARDRRRNTHMIKRMQQWSWH